MGIEVSRWCHDTQKIFACYVRAIGMNSFTPFTRHNRLSNRLSNNSVERRTTVRSTGCQTGFELGGCDRQIDGRTGRPTKSLMFPHFVALSLLIEDRKVWRQALTDVVEADSRPVVHDLVHDHVDHLTVDVAETVVRRWWWWRWWGLFRLSLLSWTPRTASSVPLTLHAVK